MAEPEKKIEIEDVLSSIRRLVAQDPLRSNTRISPESPDPEPEEALVLTASDRVEDAPAPSFAEEDEAAEAYDPATTFAMAGDDAPFTDEAPQPESAMTDADAETDFGASADTEESLDQEWEAVNQTAPAHDWPESEETDISDTEADLSETAAFDAAEMDHTSPDAPEMTDDVLQLEPHMQTRPASPLPSPAQTPLLPSVGEDFEPEEGDPAPLAGALNAFGHGGTATGKTTSPVTTAFGATEPEDDIGTAFPAFEGGDDDGPAEAEPAGINAVEEPDSEDPDLASQDWAAEPDGASPEADWHPEEDLPPELETAAEALAGSVVAAAEVDVLREATRRLHLTRPATELTAESARQGVARQSPSDGAPVFDEDALRQMVGRMIRAELQGALGEQITRKVRRLVRQEINRALISREFE
ncbi:hypothetical protein [Thioclava kandeliae]|uniref:DUF2497 domain-containing protein n=1 Tax=Thioclava kandeliae TaxID=3070818 RepID=A0ABV1SGI5_9RHOB